MLDAEQIRELSPPIPEDFEAFDPRKPVTIYRRNLPHWRQDGATYFVTLRLADSIPRNAWQKLDDEAKWWKRKADSISSFSDPQKRDFEKFQKRYHKIVEATLDECSGSCTLRHRASFELVESALFFFDGHRYSLYGYVIMPNHCHLLVRPYNEFPLERLIQSWKSYTARRIEHDQDRLWHHESHDRIVRDHDHYRKATKYLLRNPLKANLRSPFDPIYLKGPLQDRATAFPDRFIEDQQK